LGGGGRGGGGLGGGEYSTHVTHDVICAPLAVFLVALSQHSGDVDDGLSGFPWPKPSLAHLQPATMLSLEHTSVGGGLGGEGGGEVVAEEGGGELGLLGLPGSSIGEGCGDGDSSTTASSWGV
jgi:hypothetical protein